MKLALIFVAALAIPMILLVIVGVAAISALSTLPTSDVRYCVRVVTEWVSASKSEREMPARMFRHRTALLLRLFSPAGSTRHFRCSQGLNFGRRRRPALRDCDVVACVGHPADICAQAKCAMREAKNRGRANAVAFEDIREQSWLITSQQSRSLRRLIAEEALSPVFQLVWDLQRGAPLGFEALIRPDPAFGFAGPQDAFDFAEKLGIAHELDALCHSKILATCNSLDFQDLLFLNISPQSLMRDVDTLAALPEALAGAGISPSRVVLEITERSNVAPATIARAATRLRELGFMIALDDTGAGNSGLEILSQLHVDYLKIDRGLIVSACTERIARGVLVGIVTIALENGSRMIAEGIENDIMLDLVRGVGGIDALQGYLVGRPNRVPNSTLEIGTRELLYGAGPA